MSRDVWCSRGEDERLGCVEGSGWGRVVVGVEGPGREGGFEGMRSEERSNREGFGSHIVRCCGDRIM